MPFLTRCVMETLRLWPAVSNGTFRQLQYDDVVKGPEGKEVMLKKGTFVQIPNFIRHRSKKLWGPDAEIFNPLRKFRDEELWGEGGGVDYKAYNPASARFSPFTFTPRDCLGKNFAHMEMRAILAHLFHRFEFKLTSSYENLSHKSVSKFSHDGHIEVNAGTMGPRDYTSKGMEETKRRRENRQPPKLGMWLKVIPRDSSLGSGKSRL